MNLSFSPNENSVTLSKTGGKLQPTNLASGERTESKTLIVYSYQMRYIHATSVFIFIQATFSIGTVCIYAAPHWASSPTNPSANEQIPQLTSSWPLVCTLT
jgi:hypothetical protein